MLYNTNYLKEGYFLLGNKAAAVGTITADMTQPAVKLMQYASMPAKQSYTGGVLGHYFVFLPEGEKVTISTGAPMRANFAEAEDAVIFALKQCGTNQYLYGITIPKLIEWTPPARAGEMLSEEGLLQTWKVGHSDLKELVPLVDTATHKLVDLADKMLSCMPTFKAVKVRSIKDAEKYAKSGYVKTIKAVIDASELEDRKAAAEKSTTARDGGAESAAGGVDAKEVWKVRRELLLAAEPFYSDTFEERIIVVKVDATTRKASEETITKLRAELKCARPPPPASLWRARWTWVTARARTRRPPPPTPTPRPLPAGVAQRGRVFGAAHHGVRGGARGLLPRRPRGRAHGLRGQRRRRLAPRRVLQGARAGCGRGHRR